MLIWVGFENRCLTRHLEGRQSFKQKPATALAACSSLSDNTVLGYRLTHSDTTKVVIKNYAGTSSAVNLNGTYFISDFVTFDFADFPRFPKNFLFRLINSSIRRVKPPSSIPFK